MWKGVYRSRLHGLTNPDVNRGAPSFGEAVTNSIDPGALPRRLPTTPCTESAPLRRSRGHIAFYHRASETAHEFRDNDPPGGPGKPYFLSGRPRVESSCRCLPRCHGPTASTAPEGRPHTPATLQWTLRISRRARSPPRRLLLQSRPARRWEHPLSISVSRAHRVGPRRRSCGTD